MRVASHRELGHEGRWATMVLWSRKKMGGYLSAYRQKLKHGRLELKSVCGCIVIQQQNLFLISVGHCSHPLFLISDGHCYNLLSSICAALGLFFSPYNFKLVNLMEIIMGNVWKIRKVWQHFLLGPKNCFKQELVRLSMWLLHCEWSTETGVRGGQTERKLEG